MSYEEWVPGLTLEQEKLESRRQAGLGAVPRGASVISGGESVPIVMEAKNVGGNPRDLNNILSRQYQRRTVEEPRYLSLALMFVARHSERGRSICWPAPEAEQRLRLRVGGLPTKPDELLGLLRETFEEREEELDLGEVVQDYAKQFGRVQMDWLKPGIEAYRVVKR